MFDAHSAIPPAALIQLAGALQPYDVLFIEEPVVPGNIEVCKRLKAAINISAGGPGNATAPSGSSSVCTIRCLDVLQPGLLSGGGITAMKKVAISRMAYHCRSPVTAAGVTISVSSASLELPRWCGRVPRPPAEC